MGTPIQVQADPVTGTLLRPSASIFRTGNGLADAAASITIAGTTVALGGSVSLATTAALQSETATYYANIVATGGYIDRFTLDALDRFVMTGKRDGWWAKLKEVSPFCGNSLAAAVIKLKYVTQSYWTQGASGWGESNYDPRYGINAGVGNSTRWLDSNYNPSGDGLAYTNLAMGVTLSTFNSTAFGRPMVLDNGSTDNKMYIDVDVVGWNGTQTTGAFGPATRMITSAAATTLGYWNGVCMANIAVGSSFTPTGTFQHFTRYTSGSRYYGNADIAFSWCGTALSATDCTNLDAAIRQFLRAIGRLWWQKPTPAYFLGDSITYGQGASVYTKRWPMLVSKALAFEEVNCGTPNGQLRLVDTSVPAGITRYLDVTTAAPPIALVALGMNDMQHADVTTNGDATISADYQTKLETVLTSWLSVGIRVMVLGVGYTTDTGSATKISLYAAKAAAAAKNLGVPFVDVYRYMLDQTNLGVTQLEGSPATHPNDAGHATTARAVVDAWRGRTRRILSLDFGSISAGASADLTVTVLNAVVGSGQSVELDLPPALESGIVVDAFVSAADTITVRATNVTTGSINPAAGVYGITVLISP